MLREWMVRYEWRHYVSAMALCAVLAASSYLVPERDYRIMMWWIAGALAVVETVWFVWARWYRRRVAEDQGGWSEAGQAQGAGVSKS